MLNRWLFQRIDNSPLIVFRVFFGLLISCECYGAILTGWVRRTLVEPHFTFTFIGFEWLQPPPGPWMYFYFGIMGTLGLLIAAGYKYRISMVSFTLMWTAVYLMQKTSYNNHYYLLILISFFMCFLPANRYASADARINPGIRSLSMHSYVKWLIICQLFIVYTYAAIAKIYGDWLDLSFPRLLMRSKSHYYLIGEWLQQDWIVWSVAIFGILFDLLIVPALLWKRTRNFAFFCSIGFHLFNSVVFQIGIFPYLSLAFTVFFFEPETIRRIFLRAKPPFEMGGVDIPAFKNWVLAGWGIYFCIQLILPVRHHFIKDDVLWTEEGHRMSWRMMLRSRTGTITFRVVDKNTGDVLPLNMVNHLTAKQMNRIAAYPDFIWQFAQYLHQQYADEGHNVAIFAEASISINGRPHQPFIDPAVDLASEPWRHLEHHEWILPSRQPEH